MAIFEKAERVPVRWARGFFRAWVAMSALWLLLMAVIGWTSWQSSARPYIPANSHIFDPATNLVRSIGNYGEEVDAAQRGVSAGLYRRQVRAYNGVEQHFYVPATVNADSAIAMTDGVFGAIVRGAERKSSTQFWSGIPTGLAVATIPPIALLAFGSLIGWVLKGFARR